ncbi:hypothetical protein BASA60_002759, partial [Batrachochytrium salamandrivorans]
PLTTTITNRQHEVDFTWQRFLSLAITVSAQSPKSTSTQSAEQHQSTVAPILQPYMDTTGENELQSQIERIHDFHERART